mmetsp:Transcript_51286/g.119212  ORF Transcript_51286/g.119212 Transcript_51286/m.119212 type:complete len:250 (-) Transcript_51286:188-937(-)
MRGTNKPRTASAESSTANAPSASSRHSALRGCTSNVERSVPLHPKTGSNALSTMPANEKPDELHTCKAPAASHRSSTLLTPVASEHGAMPPALSPWPRPSALGGTSNARALVTGHAPLATMSSALWYGECTSFSAASTVAGRRSPLNVAQTAAQACRRASLGRRPGTRSRASKKGLSPRSAGARIRGTGRKGLVRRNWNLNMYLSRSANPPSFIVARCHRWKCMIMQAPGRSRVNTRSGTLSGGFRRQY